MSRGGVRPGAGRPKTYTVDLGPAVYVRLPHSIRQKAESKASLEGMPLSTWIRLAVEKALAP